MEAIIIVDPVSSAAFLKQAAKESGYKVIGVFSKPLPVFLERFRLSEAQLLSDCDEVITACEQHEVFGQLKASKFPIKAAIAGTDSGVLLADAISHHLGLWGNPPELSVARIDKGEMRATLKKAGLPCPAFKLCTTEQEVLAFAKNHAFPLVIKTPRGAGTSLVFICDEPQDLACKFHEIMENKDFFGQQANYAVIEEYMSGKDYAVNTFSDGKNVYVTDIWTYDKINSETFKNVYYNVFSLPLENPDLKPFISLGKKIAHTFKIERGPAHLEMKYDPKRGLSLIEINPRLAGSRMPLFLQKYSNFDPYKKTIEVFVNGTTQVPQNIVMRKHCAVAHCPIFQRGKISEILGVDLITKLASYEAHVLNVKVGDKLTPTTDMTTTPLIVFLAHENRAQLMQDVETVHALFSIKFA